MNLEFAFPHVEVWIDSESKALTAYPPPVPTTGNSPCSGANLQKHVERECPKSVVDLSPFQPSTPAETCTQIDRRGLDRRSVSTRLGTAPVSKEGAARKPQRAPQKGRKQRTRSTAQSRGYTAAIASLPGLEVTLSDTRDRLSSPSLGGKQVYTEAYLGTTNHLNVL